MLHGDAVWAGLPETVPIGEGAEGLTELLSKGPHISGEGLDVNQR